VPSDGNAISRAFPKVEPGPGFAWDTGIRYHGIECFNDTHYPVYYDHYSLKGRFVGGDRREYDRVRKAAAAGGAKFCGAWVVRRETLTNDGGSAPDQSYYRGTKQ
jgi:hypothetical protein